MRIVVFFALAIVLLSCHDGSRYSEKGGKKAENISLTRKAWKLHNDGASVQECLEAQQEALAAMRKGLGSDDPVEVLEQMGFFYNLSGDYTNAVKYYREAVDSLKSRPNDKRNEGAIQLFGDMSTLFSLLGMHELAIEYNDSSLAESRRQNGLMLSDVYRFRAGVFYGAEMIDSAIHAFDEALGVVNAGKVRADKDLLKAVIKGDKAYMILDVYGNNRDSVDRAVATLEEVVHVAGADNTDRTFALGMGYAQQGLLRKGLPLMQQAVEEYRENGELERINVSNRVLLEIYAKNKMYAELAELVPEYISVADSFLTAERSNALIGAVVKYDVQAEQDKSRILALELEVQRDRAMMFLAFTLVALSLLTGALVIFSLRRRLMAQKIRNQQQELNGLAASNSILNERVDVLEKDLNDGMNSNSAVLSTPQLITGREEGRFRRAFNVIYPHFTSNLKSEFPNLTPNDELLCMLINLGHTSEEISVYLGISRASVNSARYRLRTKFGLSKDVDLDTFIVEKGQG